MPRHRPDHGALSDEQKEAAMQRLADALTLLYDGHVPSGEGVRQELEHAHIFGGVEGLPMDLGGVAFRGKSRLVRHKIAYTLDWLLKREPRDIALQVDEDIRERLSAP